MAHPTTARAQWESTGSGISASQRTIFNISAVDENVLWAITLKLTSGIAYEFCRSTNGGTDWTAGLLPDTIGSYYPLYIQALNDQTAWVVMVRLPLQDRVRLFKTDNGGTDWYERTGDFNVPDAGFAALHFFNSDEGIAFGSPGTGDASVDSLRIYRTVDGGDDWTRIPVSALPPPLAGEGVWVYGANSYEAKGDTLWFVTRASRVFRSTDRGATWEAFDVGISGNANSPGLSSVAFQNHMQGIATSYSPSQAATTADGGETWTPIAIPSTPLAADIEYIPGTVATYIVHQDWFDGSFTTNKFLRTRNGGDTWDTLTFSPAIKVVKFLSASIGFGGSKIILPDSGGVYKWTGDIAASVHDVVQSDPALELFPNPALGQVTVRLPEHTPLPAVLTLELFNGLGQAVKRVPLRSRLTDIQLDDLSSGPYFYQLQDGEQVLRAGILMKE
ncbi:MAG: YCF48-related protein [Flavobacteriales bacterium]